MAILFHPEFNRNNYVDELIEFHSKEAPAEPGTDVKSSFSEEARTCAQIMGLLSSLR